MFKSTVTIKSISKIYNTREEFVNDIDIYYKSSFYKKLIDEYIHQGKILNRVATLISANNELVIKMYWKSESDYEAFYSNFNMNNDSSEYLIGGEFIKTEVKEHV